MYLSFSFKDILVLIVYLSQFFFDDSSCTNLVFIQLNASFNAYAPPLQERVLIYMFSVLFFYLPCITHCFLFQLWINGWALLAWKGAGFVRFWTTCWNASLSDRLRIPSSYQVSTTKSQRHRVISRSDASDTSLRISVTSCPTRTPSHPLGLKSSRLKWTEKVDSWIIHFYTVLHIQLGTNQRLAGGVA